MSNLFSINWIEIKNGLALALITGIVTMFLQIIEIGSVYDLDWKALMNSGILAFLVLFVSTLKDLLTTKKGNLLGVVQVK